MNQHKDHHHHNHHDAPTPRPERHDHDKHAGHDPETFKKKFWLSLVLTIPVLYFSQTIQHLLDYSTPSFAGSEYIPAVFGIVIFFYGGMVFLRSAKIELLNRQPGMMTLISLAITVAFIYSSLITLNIIDGMDFWWELATLVTIMLLGHWLEMASVMNARGALQELAKLLPDETELVSKSGTVTIPVSQLAVGDILLVRPGSQIPVDGVVIKGASEVNEATLTGESAPVDKHRGDQVMAGTLNGNGSLTVKVSKTGNDTALAGIMKLVYEAQSSKSHTQLLADRVANLLFYFALAAAIATAVSWLIVGESSTFILERVVAVLVIACPHALGLAIPLVTAISTSKAASAGVIVRERRALEVARDIDIILFDKTGTLTTGEQGVIDIIGENIEKLLAVGAGVEQESEHPIARAVVTKAQQMHITIPSSRDFTALAGQGAKAKIGASTYYVGGLSLLKELEISIDDRLRSATARAHSKGQTVVYVIEGQTIKGAFMIADTIRPGSRKAVEMLQKTGKKVVLVTGDSHGVARWVAAELNIDEYHAETPPAHKSTVVKNLQQAGLRVAFVGDGINDAPALTQADVGIAIGAGTDVAIESADIVLTSNDPQGVLKILNLSKISYHKMYQNIAWATGYNVVAIPAAAGLFSGVGFVLSPAIGAILMSASTIIVALNAQLLWRSKI